MIVVTSIYRLTSTTCWKISAVSDAASLQTVVETRPDTGGAESAHDFAGFRDAHLVEDEDVLHRDDVAFHACELGDVGQTAGTVAEPRHLHE